MPESKHRRKGKPRPRQRHVVGPQKKPPPSPRWVPIVGVALIILGVMVVIANYIPGFIERNWVLFLGFGFMAVGFGFLMRYR
jgi:hypothetical protein